MLPAVRHAPLLLSVAFLGVAGSFFLPGKTVFRGQVFTDVPPEHPFANAIESLRADGIVRGGNDATFRPESPINRAEFTMIVVDATVPRPQTGLCTAFLEQGGRTMPFSDVAKGAWYEAHVCTAFLQGMIGGFADGTFRPAESVSFGQAAKVLARAFHLSVGEEGDVWYRPFVDALARQRAIPPEITSVGSPITRGQMAEMIDRLRRSVTDRPSADLSSLEHGPVSQMTAVEREAFALINAEREQSGLTSLREHPLLLRAALRHADDMEARGFYAHTGSDGSGPEQRVRDTGYFQVDLATCGCRSWQYRYGENLLQGSFTPQQAVREWMQSTIHRDNILSPVFTDAALIQRGSSWVLVFGRIILQ